MFCPKCGTENVEGAQLCSSCSWVLSSVSTAPAPDAKTSKVAIRALVLGILAPFTCLLTTLPAIICGIVGLVKINKSRGQLKGTALAITGMVIPIVVLPIIAIMAAIALPALGKARAQAKQVVCASHLKQLGLSMIMSAADHNNVLPSCDKWCDEVKPYLGQSAEKVFQCPVAKNAACAYAMNKNIKTLANIKSPATMVLLFESNAGCNQGGGPELLSSANHCGKGCNVAFCDGHVEFVKVEDIPKLKWTADANK
jgi:prepilin-type processing-associated H-X9-DG protein